MCQVEGYRNIKLLSYRTLAFTSYKVFLKNKKRSRASLPASLSVWLLKKIFFFILMTDQVLFFPCLYFVRYWAICVLQSFAVINFESYLIFLIKPFFYMTRKSRQKFKYLENEKSFFIISKGLPLKQRASFSWRVRVQL